MKKILPVALGALLLFISAVSCSKDEGGKMPLKPQNNEIKMVFNTATGNNEALLYISGENFTIDWGDGKTSVPADVDDNFSIRHKYTGNREYIITITTKGKLEYFKNFSANRLWDFEEEKIPVFESISIGKDVTIDILYIQSSGVKKFTFANEDGFKEAYLLLGSGDWDLSQLRAKKLSMYVIHRRDLDIKNLSTTNLSITLKNEINNLSLSSCDQLLYLDISAILQRKATIKHLTVANMPKLEDLRYYALNGKSSILSDLPALKFFWSSGFNYETMEMNNKDKDAVFANLTFKAYGISVRDAIRFNNQLVALEIDNTQSGLTSDIAVIDLSLSQKLKTVNVIALQSLENIKFGDKNNVLDEVVLKSLPKLKSVDLSLCENLKKLEVRSCSLFESAKFGAGNKLLESTRFENTNFSITSCIDMINTLPDFYIPDIPSVNRRRLMIVGNKLSLSNNPEITEAIQKIRPYWVCYIE